MKASKISAPTLRKILRDNGFEGPGKRDVDLVANRIRYGKTSVPTGMKIYKMFRDTFQVWACTKNPGDDIERAVECFREHGYKVEYSGGFCCWVELYEED